MLINWFTVIAQIINFIILVALLKRFLYKPVLKAIDEREKKIAAQIEDAKKREAEAIKEQDEFQAKNKEFDQQRNALMNKAVEEANAERHHLLDEAKKEAQVLRGRLEESLKENQEHLSNEISRRTQKEVFAIAKKTLQELADSSLEDQMVKIFIQRLQNANEEEKKKLISSFNPASQTITVQSVFELTEPQKKDIEDTVNKISGIPVHLKFETAPELVSGIELNSDGYKLAWSISEYFDSMKRNVEQLVNSKTTTTE